MRTTRSGPRGNGRLDARPRRCTGSVARRPRLGLPGRRAQGEERPEVAAHVSHEEKTRVHVSLEAGCPDPVSTYDGESHATITHSGTFECTNDDPAICPVELNAFGSVFVDATGDLDYYVEHSDLTDIDELERLTEAPDAGDDDHADDQASILPPPPGAWDSHDHEQRDRMAFSGDDHDHDFQEIEAMTWSTRIRSGSSLDCRAARSRSTSGGTTERVSTHVEHEIDTNLRLDAEMEQRVTAKRPAAAPAIRGHVCHCDPKFKLVLNDTQTAIIVDGKTFLIDRPSRGGRDFPPAIPAPNRYQAWPLV